MGRKLRRKATQENIIELGRTVTKGAEMKVVRRRDQRILGRMQNNRRMENTNCILRLMLLIAFCYVI
jgi:hypothetical protein